MSTGDRLLTPKDLAAYLQVAPGTIFNWVSQRRIPHLHVGRLLRFDRHMVDQWLLANATDMQDWSEDRWKGKG